MTVGEALEVLVDAYVGWPWDARSVLIAAVIDRINHYGWGIEC